MSEAKPTPGPWLWDEPSNWLGLSARVFTAEPYSVIAEVSIEAWRPRGIGRANARLIAKSPEMFALLQELIDMEGPQPGNVTWAQKVQKLIAEVEGR